MKFSFAIVSALATVASSTKLGNLRAASDTSLSEMQGQVFIGGLLRVPTEDE